VLEHARFVPCERLPRDVGRDVGIAVAVAADPRCVSHERADPETMIGVCARERSAQVIVEPCDDVEYRPLEKINRVGGLVGDRDWRGAQLFGLPQRRQHLQCFALDRTSAIERPVEPRCFHRHIAFRERASNALELVENGAAPRFGRVCGQRRADFEAVDEDLYFGSARTRTLQALYRLGDRFGPRSAWGACLARPVYAHDLLLLGRVDELKKERIGAQNPVHEVRVPKLRQPLEQRSRVCVVAFVV
jgi:hypothetical protein